MLDFTGAVWSTNSTCLSEFKFSLFAELQLLLSPTLLLLWQLCASVAFVVLSATISILGSEVLDAAEHSETEVDGISVGCKLGRESVAWTVEPIAGVTLSGVTQLSAGVLLSAVTSVFDEESVTGTWAGSAGGKKKVLLLRKIIGNAWNKSALLF